MEVIYATVQQNTIHLPDGVALSDGTQVEIRMRQSEQDTQRETEAEGEMRFKEKLLKMGKLSSISKRPSTPWRKVTVSPNTSGASEDDFKYKLLEAGLITTIKPAISPGWKRHEPVVIPGKPLSEIIIEERR